MSDEDYEQGFSEGYDQGLSTDKEKSFLILAARIDELKKENARLCAENERLREALNRIAERHIPDQPASGGQDEADYVRNHYAQLRWIAKCAALEGVTEKEGAGNE